MQRVIPPLIAVILMMPFIGRAADTPKHTEDSASVAEQMAHYRDLQLKHLHDKLGIRDDQARLWEQLEQRLAPLYLRSAALMEQVTRDEPERVLDKQQLLNESAKAEASDQRRFLDTLRWLHSQLDGQQRKELDEFENLGVDSSHDPEAAGRLTQATSKWLARRATLKQELHLRPDQLVAWRAFEAETELPMPHTRTLMLDGAQPAQPPFAQMEAVTRMKEGVCRDIGDWLASVRRLDRVLDQTQKSVLDAFLAEHVSPLV